MAIEPRRRQRKLERRKAKDKARQRVAARRRSGGVASLIQRASAAPFLHSCISGPIWDEGIGQMVVSRRLSDGNVAFGAFLVDTYCLGVKDAFADIASQARYQHNLYDKLAHSRETIRLKPECARKLIEGAIQYAAGLGFAPHPDYHTAKMIFGDVSAEACTREFSYGKDGKPFFIAGPYDSPERCEYVLQTLHDRCGPGGYHFLVPIHDRQPI
jgi:hypothetical protein